MALKQKLNSNDIGIRYAEETSIGVLPGTPVWYPLDANTVTDFGGQITTVARDPLKPDRQRRKGQTTDLEAMGSIGSDLVQDGLQDIMQGFMFASSRDKVEVGGAGEITGVVTLTDDFQAASGLDAFAAGDLVFATGFTYGTNNGFHVVTASTATTLTVATNLVDEPSPPTAAKLVQVGYQFDAGDLEWDVSSGYPKLTTTTKDMTDLGLIPGEFIYIGGDTTIVSPVNSENTGRCRVRSVSANEMVLDKTAFTMVAETAGTQTIQIFFSRVLKNETGDLIIRRTYNVEEDLGAPETTQPTDHQAVYLVGAVPNELTLEIPTADKAAVDLSFMALDAEPVDFNTGLKGGTRPAGVEESMYNTSSHVPRVNLTLHSTTDSNPTPLFAFVREMTLTINNNVSGDKAIGVLGSFDATHGNFEVSGSMTAYFADVTATNAVRDNLDVSLDVHFAKENQGLSMDLPLISLGDGRPNVEKDAPITLPLTQDAATGAKIDPNLNHTLMFMFWDYLPTVAMD